MNISGLSTQRLELLAPLVLDLKVIGTTGSHPLHAVVRRGDTAFNTLPSGGWARVRSHTYSHRLASVRIAILSQLSLHPKRNESTTTTSIAAPPNTNAFQFLRPFGFCTAKPRRTKLTPIPRSANVVIDISFLLCG
jgi:hypothetical protein